MQWVRSDNGLGRCPPPTVDTTTLTLRDAQAASTYLDYHFGLSLAWFRFISFDLVWFRFVSFETYSIHCVEFRAAPLVSGHNRTSQGVVVRGSGDLAMSA